MFTERDLDDISVGNTVNAPSYKGTLTARNSKDTWRYSRSLLLPTSQPSTESLSSLYRTESTTTAIMCKLMTARIDN